MNAITIPYLSHLPIIRAILLAVRFPAGFCVVNAITERSAVSTFPLADKVVLYFLCYGGTILACFFADSFETLPVVQTSLDRQSGIDIHVFVLIHSFLLFRPEQSKMNGKSIQSGTRKFHSRIRNR